MRAALLLFGSLSLTFAMSASPSYIQNLKNYLTSKEFDIYGLFYMYDFNHDNKIDRNDWIYITNDEKHKAFRLMGKTPTDKDPFGWLELSNIPSDLNLNKPSGYFALINFPEDFTLQGSNAFSWIYASVGKAYKLMGADANHNFDYLDENGDGKADPLSNIAYTIIDNGKKIRFTHAAAYEQKFQCEDERGFGTLYMKASSWYSGNIAYYCKFDASTKWELKTDSITIANIRKSEKVSFTFDENSGQGTSTYDYAQGVVHIQGKYNNKTIDCYEYYTSILPITINKFENDKLEKVMEDWGDGPCDPYFIRTTCPAWYYSDLKDCNINGSSNDNSAFNTAKTIDAHLITNWEVTENGGKVDKVYKEEIFKKQ